MRTEAGDWANSDEAMWANFAQHTMPGSSVLPLVPSEACQTSVRDQDSGGPTSTSPRASPPSTTLRALALRDLRGLPFSMPKAYDMGHFRFESHAPEKLLNQTPLEQALEDHPEALMDIIDAEGEGHKSMRTQPNDFRPNRVIKRSTRTSRVVRRTGVFNSTAHRDRAEAEQERKRLGNSQPWKSARVQKMAAEKIQRVWRAWYQYCKDNSEWMTVTWICATMIQSHWRSYHVRRQVMDKHASMVQRHIRGFLVRSVLKRHTAAVCIQRHAIGMLTRKKL